MRITRILIACVACLVFFTACGSAKTTKDTTLPEDRIESDNDLSKETVETSAATPEKTANIIDEIWLDKYDREFVASKDYNPLFFDRCFYVKGVKVHIPTTVRGFEKLFGAEFTSAVHYGYYSNFRDDSGLEIQVEFMEKDKDDLGGQKDYDDKLKDVPIIGFYYDDTPYGKEHCILKVYDVSFESVPQEGKDCANDFGYDVNANIGDTDKSLYRFYPDCYQAYYLYLNRKLPAEFIDDGLDISVPDYNRVEYGDVTLDTLDEMFCWFNFDVQVLTYDPIDRKLRRIYTTTELDSLSTEDGVLICSFDPEGFQDYYELTDYMIFNRYGKQWQLARLERWQDENYNKHHTIDGNEVDEDTYIEASRLYGNRGSFGGAGIELTVWGFRTNDGSYEKIMDHREELKLDAIGFDPDARPENTDKTDAEEKIDGDYDILRDALTDAGFDVDRYGLGEFFVIVNASDGYVNVREECSTTSAVVTQIPNGTQIYVGDCHVDEDGRLWGALTEPEFIGYVAMSQVKQVGN